ARVAREGERAFVVCARGGHVVRSRRQIGERRVIEDVAAELLAIERRELGETALRAVQLRDRDRATQRDDRRRRDRRERVVEPYDVLPRRLFERARRRVARRDRGLDMKRRGAFALGRSIEQLEPARHELAVPQFAALLEERQKLSALVEARRQTRRVKMKERRERERRRRARRGMLDEQHHEPERLAT